MCSEKSAYAPQGEVLKYTYPRLHTGKTWYVDFQAFDPALNKMRRKKYMLMHIPKIGERRKYATDLCNALLDRLRKGWSPWCDVHDNRGYTSLVEALEKYEKSLEHLPKLKTRQSYSSRLNVLREYIGQMVLPPHYVYQYNTGFVTDFLDWLYLDRDVTGRTRNNYRGWCSSLAAFFIEREYIHDNPVTNISNVDEAPKKRKAITDNMLKQMRAYLYEHDRHFLLACMLEYYTMVRPAEMSNIHIKDIYIKDQKLFIPAEVSKNKRDGNVGLNEEILKLMIELGVFNYPDNFYLFGENFLPGVKKGSSEMFRRKWLKLRRALKWSDVYQFYSLKDSGITDLANAKGIVIARDQARHTDISTTNKYLQGRDLPVHPETQHFKGNL